MGEYFMNQKARGGINCNYKINSEKYFHLSSSYSSLMMIGFLNTVEMGY
jgi:hypothetical protein